MVCIPNVADLDETKELFEIVLEARGNQPAARGRSRFSVSDPTAFGSSDVVLTCDEILLRVLDHLDDEIPSIYEHLFRPSEEWAERQPLNAQGDQPSVPPPDHLGEMCDGLRDLYMMGELEWSEAEPLSVPASLRPGINRSQIPKLLQLDDFSIENKLPLPTLKIHASVTCFAKGASYS